MLKLKCKKPEMKRILRFVYLRIVRANDSPPRVAAGVAIGVFLGIFPTFGLGLVLAYILAVIFRINKAAAVCLMDSDDKKYFSSLPVGQGIIKLQDRWMQPFLVKFPLMDIQKGAVTDEVLLRYFNEISSKTTHSPRKMSVPPAFDGFPRIPFDVILDRVFHSHNIDLS